MQIENLELQTNINRIMKNMFFIIATMLCCCLKVFSQATSLTVDCQTPGWLSSMINYGDQQTLENIKVTGFINGTDIKFIRELNLNRSLSGVINLEEANIVSGGEAYGHFSTGFNSSYNPTTEDNTITDYMFAYLKPIRKVILPCSTTSFSSIGNGQQFVNTSLDTLVINGIMENISIGGGKDNYFWKTQCIYFPEGIKNINFGSYFHSYTIKNKELYLPSTLGVVDGKSACADETTVFHCSSLRPDTIKEGYDWIESSKSMFLKGTIYVPKGTKEIYEQSIFKNLNIIEDIHVEGIILDGQKSAYVGDEIQLVAEITPTDALNQDIKWESCNPDVATVSEDGKITALSYGNTDIVATTIDGGFKAICKVCVFEHTTGIEMQDKISLPINGTYNLNAHTLPLSKSDDKITYNCGNSEVASVNEQGIVTAKQKGICTITAISVDGGYTATCEVTVTQPVETLTLEKHSITLKVGESERLFAQISPSKADDKTISWHSSNEQIAYVDADGNVTAIKAGEAWIKAVSQDNVEAKDSCKIKVLQPVTGIRLSHSSHQMKNIGESFLLEAIVEPDDASNKEVKWSSSNTAVCVVSNGNVVATGFGSAIVMAITADGGHIDFCTVTVKEETEEYNLTIKQAVGGSVTTKVKKNSTHTFAISVEDGWAIHAVSINDFDYTEQVNIDNSLTISNIEKDIVISVVFEKNTPTTFQSPNSSLKIESTSYGASVSNARVGDVICVYGEDGVLQKSIRVTGAKMDVALERSGVYIIKVSGKIVKLRY